MAKRKVYIGNFNNKKKEELINKSIENLKANRGNEFYYILPNGELLRDYRNYFIEQVDQAFEINLFTFDDIVNKVLEEDFTHIIDNPTKNLILREVFKGLQDEDRLHYYKDFTDMPRFINSINDILGDIKRSLVYPREYIERAPKTPFYQEMGLIYLSYEEILDDLKSTDREGSYLKAAKLLEDKEHFPHVKTIIIDEFYDFRPIELAILEQLSKGDMDIIINMPFLSRSKSIILDNTLKILKDLNFDIEYIEKEPSNIFEDLGTNLFSSRKPLFEYNHEVTLINGATPYLELRKIFEKVKKYHKSGINLKDMGLIISNQSYLEPLYKISTTERIPLSINKASPLKSMPITREILNILDNKINNYSKSLLINRIKSNYFEICLEEKRDLYETVLRGENFQDLNDLKAILDSNKKLNISIEEMEILKNITHLIESESSKIFIEDTIINFNQAIRSIIKDFKLKDNIVNRYKEKNDEALLLRDLRSLNKIEEVIGKMELLVFFKEKISLEDYYYLFIDYIEEETVTEIQGNTNGLHILNPTNSRGALKDIIFISGLAQDSYPSLDDSNYFINDYNLKDLKSIGIDVKNYMERLNNEGLKFASLLASCKSKLYLSYSSGYEGKTIKSIFLEEVISLFKEDEEDKVKIDEIKINLDYLVKNNLEDISNYDDLSKYLLKTYFKGQEMDLDIFKYYNQVFNGKFNSINNKILSEINRYGSIFDEYRGFLHDESIIQDIKSNMPRAFSISYLESYSKCPYFFMLNNLLEVEEMERDFQDYSPIDIGVLYHDVLSKYYKLYSKDIEASIKEDKDFVFEDTISTIKKLVYDSGKEIGLKSEYNRDILIIEIAFDRLRDFLKKDTERILKDRLIPSYFEKDFGSKEPFNLESNNRKIPMVGRIDRIDKFTDSDKYMAIDYKSSSYGLKDIGHMMSGLSLQLPVYILSQEDKDMVAGAYSIIKDGDTRVNLGLKPFVNGRRKGILSQEEWDGLMETTKENIYDILSNIEKGNFQVEPKDCSPYCIYKDICRYIDILEVE